MTFTQSGQVVATMKYGAQDAGQGYYPEGQFLGTTPWKELMPMQVTATGSTVGAFSGTVVPPTYVSGLKPSFDGLYDVYARASQGLTVTWRPEAPGTRIMLDLFTVGGPGDVYCYADDSAGAVTVPPSMFTHLSLYATAASSIISIARMASTQIQAPNANVELVALVFQPACILTRNA